MGVLEVGLRSDSPHDEALAQALARQRSGEGCEMSRWPQRNPERPHGRTARARPGPNPSRRGTERRDAPRPGKPRGPRTPRERKRDPRERRVPFEERKRLALDDLSIYRAVSFRNLSEARFGGNDFAARRGLSQLGDAGLVVRGKGWGPHGRPFLILAATASGAGVRAAAPRGLAGQRRWHGW